jgi:hypothetical protein
LVYGKIQTNNFVVQLSKIGPKIPRHLCMACNLAIIGPRLVGYVHFFHSFYLLLLFLRSLKTRNTWVMVFNATFNNISVISWQLVLLVNETRVPGENHRPTASH